VPFTDAVGQLSLGRIPIAVVMTSFEPGGTERQMIEMVRRLDPNRWAVHIACFHARGTWFGRATERAASVAEFPVRSFRNPATMRHAWAFARWCRARRIAVVHTTELYANIFGLPAAALARVPVRIANRREINPDKTPAQIAMQRTAYAFAHRIVANSRAAANRLELERVPRRKTTVIPNGLDLGSFHTPPRPKSRLRNVIVVANLRPEKGHDVLIDAAANILLRVPDARFDFVGDGPGRDSLLERVRALGIERAFTFHGHRDDIPDCLAAADIFVLPSRSEAFPNAVLEAMAAGLPIVASAVGGIAELIADNRTGLLVPPDDPASLCARLSLLMTDSSLGSRIGDAARAEARAHYSFDRMVTAFDRLYVNELARRGALTSGQPQLAAS
jgi:glycosyltransferase involved in cell wall biosynthesis